MLDNVNQASRAALAQTIERHIIERTWGRIHQLQVEVDWEHVVVRGSTTTYYSKQLAIQAVLEVLGSQEAGVVCFPSFHVAWAIFFVAALWGFRWLRIPAVIVSAMVILSTMTTGWHYFVDVLGGIVLAVISIVFAKRLTSRMDTRRR